MRQRAEDRACAAWPTLRRETRTATPRGHSKRGHSGTRIYRHGLGPVHLGGGGADETALPAPTVLSLRGRAASDPSRHSVQEPQRAPCVREGQQPTRPGASKASCRALRADSGEPDLSREGLNPGIPCWVTRISRTMPCPAVLVAPGPGRAMPPCRRPIVRCTGKQISCITP